MPKPQQDESQDDFINRCVSEVMEEEDLSQEEALGRCFGIWEAEKGETSKSDRLLIEIKYHVTH